MAVKQPCAATGKPWSYRPANFPNDYPLMKRGFTFLIPVLSFFHLCAQHSDSADFEARPTSLAEVSRRLGGDSMLFYYNDKWQLVKPVCATMFRISKMDTVLLTFTGKFVDYYTSDSTIAMEGNYTKGKKEGLFTSYFPNGQPAQSGRYVNDQKSGLWEYFYEDGTRRQVLDFRDGEVLVKDFWNEEGKQLVAGGNGAWFNYASSDRFIKTSGDVLNGRKNGTWKNTIPSQDLTTNVEKYKEGNLISGKMNSVFGGTESYRDTQYCAIEKTPAYVTAEQFVTNRCFKKEKNVWEYATYPGGADRFYGQIRERLLLSESIPARGVMKIHITIDKEGKMTNFKPISNLGYESALIEVLQTMDYWRPTKVNGKPVIQPKVISLEIR